jgi:hypothetical protein
MRRASASTGSKTHAPRTRSRPRSRRRRLRWRAPSALQPPSQHDLPSSPAARAGQARGHSAAPSRAITLLLSTRPCFPVARFLLALRQRSSLSSRPAATTLAGGEAAQPPGSLVATPVVSPRPRRLADVADSSRHPLSLGVEAVCTNPAARHARSVRRKPTALPAHARNDRWPSLRRATTSLVAHARRLQQIAFCHLAPLLLLCPGCLTFAH